MIFLCLANVTHARVNGRIIMDDRASRTPRGQKIRWLVRSASRKKFHFPVSCCSPNVRVFCSTAMVYRAFEIKF